MFAFRMMNIPFWCKLAEKEWWDCYCLSRNWAGRTLEGSGNGPMDADEKGKWKMTKIGKAESAHRNGTYFSGDIVSVLPVPDSREIWNPLESEPWNG